MRRYFLCALLPMLLWGHQTLYLVQQGQVQEGIHIYLEQTASEGHDFELLSQLGQILLEQGARSQDPEIQLLSLYGSSMAKTTDSMRLYEEAMLSKDPMIEMTAIHCLGQIDDDQATALLALAFNSHFLPVRLEAAYYLAQRKHPLATEQLEGLMHKLPPQMRVYFPEFFALIGTPKAIAILRQLINDNDLNVRSAAALSAADFGRDDLLSYVRAMATHKNPAELEVSAIALAKLGDTHARDNLLALTASPYANVQLAAHKALYVLGATDQMQSVAMMAKNGDIHAILALGAMQESASHLIPLLSHANQDVRFNAALALLQQKDPSCVPIISEFLTAYTHETALLPSFSTGRSMSAWRFAPPSVSYSKLAQTNVMALTHAFKERILGAALNLPEKDFLQLARLLLDTQVTPLIGSLIHHLESMASDGAISLLKFYSNAIGAPLTRALCYCALYRLNIEGPYLSLITQQAAQLQNAALIRIQPKPQKQGTIENTSYSPLSLSPDETSRLLIETYQTLALRNEPIGLEILLRAIADGNPKNRYALAGILLKALE